MTNVESWKFTSARKCVAARGRAQKTHVEAILMSIMFPVHTPTNITALICESISRGSRLGSRLGSRSRGPLRKPNAAIGGMERRMRKMRPQTARVPTTLLSCSSCRVVPYSWRQTRHWRCAKRGRRHVILSGALALTPTFACVCSLEAWRLSPARLASMIASLRLLDAGNRRRRCRWWGCKQRRRRRQPSERSGRSLLMQVLPYPDGAQIPVGAAGGEKLTRRMG